MSQVLHAHADQSVSKLYTEYNELINSLGAARVRGPVRLQVHLAGVGAGARPAARRLSTSLLRSFSELLRTFLQAFVSQLADSQPASALSAPAVPLPLSALVAAPRSEPPLHTSSREQVPLPLGEVASAYRSASRRLLVLGVGGMLLPAASEAAGGRGALAAMFTDPFISGQ